MASPTFPYDAHGAVSQGSQASGSAPQAYASQYQSAVSTYYAQQQQASTPRSAAYMAQPQLTSAYNVQMQQQQAQQQAHQHQYQVQQQPQPQQQQAQQQYHPATTQQQQALSLQPPLVHSAESPAWILQPAMWVHSPPNWVQQPAIWVPPVVLGAQTGSAANAEAGASTVNTPASSTANAAAPMAIEAAPEPQGAASPQLEDEHERFEEVASPAADPTLSYSFTETFSDIGPALDKVPDDVLLQIFVQLDNPWSFSRTSKRLRSVSKDGYFRAQWFLTRFQKHKVLFEAIARPEIFTVDLFRRLIRGRAVLSRSLAQLLRVLHTPSLISGMTTTNWGRYISFDAWWAVLEEAKKLYGSIPLDSRLDLDSLVFNAIIHGNFGTFEDVKRLFVEYRFMPLPLCFENRGGFYHNARQQIIVGHNTSGSEIRQILANFPSLAEAVRANGYVVPHADAVWMARKIFAKSREGSSRQEILAQLQHFQKLGLLRITREVASEVVYSLRDPGGTPKADDVGGAAFSEAYRALVQLDRSGELQGFEIKSVIEEIVSTWRTSGAVDSSMICLTDHVELDYPEIDLGWLVARTTFLKNTNNLDFIKTLMGRHEVLFDDVLQASLYNLSISTLPLQYAVKFLEGFNLVAFLKQLLDAILSQPYRGQMLRKLHGLFCLGTNMAQGGVSLKGSVDFLQMLADAVEAQGFGPSQLPMQQWNLASGTFDNSPVVRSILAYDVNSRNASGLLNVSATTDSKTPTGPFLDSFTRFRRQGSVDDPALAGQHAELQASEHDVDQSKPRFQGLDDALWVDDNSLIDHRGHRRRALQNRRLNNIYGAIPAGKDHVPEAIVDILGSYSKSADILLSHALLNGTGSLELVARLLQKGVPLTLEHFKICMKTGHGVPLVLLRHIHNGARFKLSFDAQGEESDSKLLTLKKGRAKAALSQQESSMCQAISQTGTSGTAVFIEMNESGSAHVTSEPQGRTGVLKEIITQPSATTAAATSATTSPAYAAAINEGGSSATVDTRQAPRTRSAAQVNAASYAPPPPQDSEAGADEGYVVKTPNGGSIFLRKTEVDRRKRSLELWTSHLAALRYLEDRRTVFLKACQWVKVSLKRNSSQKELADVFLKNKAPGLVEMAKALQEAQPAAVVAAQAAAAAAEQAAAAVAAQYSAQEGAENDAEPAAKRLKTGPTV